VLSLSHRRSKNAIQGTPQWNNEVNSCADATASATAAATASGCGCIRDRIGSTSRSINHVIIHLIIRSQNFHTSKFVLPVPVSFVCVYHLLSPPLSMRKHACFSHTLRVCVSVCVCMYASLCFVLRIMVVVFVLCGWCGIHIVWVGGVVLWREMSVAPVYSALFTT